MKDSYGTYDGRKEEPPYDCPSCAALREEVARLKEEARSYRMSIGMILLSIGGTVCITRNAQEDIDMRDEIDSATNLDGTITLNYRRRAGEGT